MKVSMWYNNNDIRVEEVPTPSPGKGEILVKVISCGICGSDMVEWYRLPRAPLVQGHEVGVEVVETGEGVKKFEKGDRLFIAPKVPCLKCSYCIKGHYPQCVEVKDRLPGGFAEYILVPKELVKYGSYLLPDHVSYDQATFIEPLACVVRAQRLASIEAGQTILVLGSGMTGLLHVKLAKHKNCKVIATDINPNRLELAKRFGADHVADAASDVLKQLEDVDGKKADAVIVTTSALAALKQAWKTVEMGGVVVLFAVPGPDKDVVVPVNDFWRKEIRIITSYYCGPPDIEQAINLIAKRDITVDDLITHRLPLKDTDKGFKMLLEGADSLKIIIKPQEE
ncbi:MAG: zinc-binding dehydrogenase [Deltaproteobacteria bacterium]|nr:zinc-binding dehydrogenase [Deltaproteobacteria bacterium]MBW1871804.1 zinc-binding dehydrogenase [Deltaproteobacteria bacterium]